MSSSPEPARRRRNRSDVEDVDDQDDNSSQLSTPVNTPRAKRVRRDDDHDSESDAAHGAQDDSESEDGRSREDVASGDGFQPGSIRRVKVTNFVTYEKAEFFPGPNLNMVIGPNGTGKSSLVCAICLGLGLGPQHLGRAGEVGEFVKHGMDEAEIEVELQKKAQDRENYVVRVRIIRDGNKREWYLAGRKSTLKAVQELTKSLSIQIDNLCQFLPQDKVSEFAALSPVDLLLQTQRAAAPEEMLQQHEELKACRKEQKQFEQKQAEDQERLDSLENRQQNLQAEVQRLHERQEIQQKVMILQKKIPFVEYRIARAAHIECKQKKLDAQARLRDLRQRVQPILEDVQRKEILKGELATVTRERERAVKASEDSALQCTMKMESLDSAIEEIHSTITTEQGKDTARKTAIRKTQQEIRKIENQMNEPAVQFDNTSWNDRIATLSREIRELNHSGNEKKAVYAEYNRAQAARHREKKDIEDELALFDSAEGQQFSKLESVSSDSAKAWKWIQEHRAEFEQEVYGPPIVSCSVKNTAYVDQIESLFQRNDWITFTTQTDKDYTTLSRALFGSSMKLSDIAIKRVGDRSLSSYTRPPAHMMQEFGFQHWALDLVDGPEPVLAMLCQALKLNITGISLQDISEDQHSKIVQSNINSWVTGRHSNRMTRRVEYGPSAVSVRTTQIQPARYWTDRPVDASKRDEIVSRIRAIEDVNDETKEKALVVRKEMDALRESWKEKVDEEKSQKAEKAKIQKAWHAQQALPAQLQAEKTAFEERVKEGADIRRAINKLANEKDKIVLEKIQHTFDLHKVIVQLRQRHQDVIEAKIRLIETDSDISSLKERNKNITDQVGREEELVRNVEIESKRVKDVAARALAVCQEIQADEDNALIIDAIREDHGMTIESLEQDIAAEQAKLEFIQAGNPRAIEQFEARQKELDALKENMAQKLERLQTLEAKIARTRGRWEPELDRLIAKISEAFSYNFEQIGCAGEVSVHKDEDFELWAVQIKVRFRENETLQLLDAHRQSGGERSVSTIFYLMSLQSMARAPFRVVDEINQGMDPRNERMVHERMVEIACKEHTSQYFLITPKLLTGLRYDKRMKVLCIASGEHMPKNYSKLDVSKIIGIQKMILAGV